VSTQQQIDLFAAVPEPRKLARRGAPTTSKLAAMTVANFATAHHAAIVQALKEHGARGLTVHEIAAFCRLDAHAIGKRMNELQAGQVIETRVGPGGWDLLTRKSPSGRAARVWFLTPGARLD
jgi:predicted ArsR family transcriptional regulator